MQTIKFKPEIFNMVLDGRKSSTIRMGLRDYTLGEVLLETDPPHYTIHGEIVKLEKKQLMHLTEENAQEEGYSCLSELLGVLLQIYPDIASISVITVVHFRHAE